MHWIFFAVVLALCVYHRTFRYVCLSLAGTAALLLAGVLWGPDLYRSLAGSPAVPTPASHRPADDLYQQVYGSTPPAAVSTPASAEAGTALPSASPSRLHALEAELARREHQPPAPRPVSTPAEAAAAVQQMRDRAAR